MNKKYDPKKEIEKLCEENKIFFYQGKEDYEDMCDIGLGSILHNELSKFLERNETNGFHLIKVINPENKEEVWKIKIKYEGGENPVDRMKSSFILDQTKLPQRIDQAVGRIKVNGDYFRYYGVLLDEEIEKQGRQGETITIIKKVHALVLENGEIISENSKPEGVSFEFDSIMTLKHNRWSLSSIKQFTKGEYDKEDFIFKNVFNEFKEKYVTSMVYEEEEVYSFRSLRDLKSYFWDINDKFLILKSEGISGTAKSKNMKIGANLSFNGKKFLCPTPANFFRYRHNNKSTLFVEEAEKLFDTSKKKNVGDSELVEYLNGSYEKGNTVPRQNDKNINQTDEFDPAGETEIGSINPLKGALEKRSIPLQMIKAPKNDVRGNVEIPPETDPEYCNARDKAYICGLLNYKKFEKSLKEAKNIYGLRNREWILAKPYVALASCISPELEKKIGNFISRKFVIRDDSFDSESWERIMAEVLIEIFSEKEEFRFISTKHIKGKFLSKLGGDYNKLSSQKINGLVDTLGFSDFKGRNSDRTDRGYEIGFWKLSEILIRNDWVSKEEIIKKLSNLSVCPITEDKINKWYSDNFRTKDKLNLTEQETFGQKDRQDNNPRVEINNLDNFTDEEIKKAGWTREQLMKILTEDLPDYIPKSITPIENPNHISTINYCRDKMLQEIKPEVVKIK
ncbi:MAG: hypothetical protein ABIB79_03440 [archaeon]